MSSTRVCNTRLLVTQFDDSPRSQEIPAAGIQLGMNLGESAGAGIAEHIHMHVLPEDLTVTWRKLRDACAKSD